MNILSNYSESDDPQYDKPSARENHDLLLQLRRVEDELTVLRRLVEYALPAAHVDNERQKPEELNSDYNAVAYESQFPTDIIYHITPAAYYNSDPKSDSQSMGYLPEQYGKDGFIHCTRGADLLVLVANNIYRSVPGDFVMLVISVKLLKSPLKYEALDPAAPLPFPHIYGPLNRDAIVKVIRMKRAEDGTFLAPPFGE